MLPVQSLATALTKAKASLATRVYAAVGDYTIPNTIILTAAENGIIVEGGWVKSGPNWSPECSPNRRNYTTFVVESAMGVRVEGLTVPGGFWHLTIATKSKGSSPGAQAGESVYGIFVAGQSTVLNLYDVDIVAGDGGDGGSPALVPEETETSSCNGHAGCCTTEVGCGTAAGPTPPGSPAPGSAAGSNGVFGLGGYEAAHGTAGVQGVRGYHGKAGGAGQDKGNVCRIGGSCGICRDGGGNPACPGNCGPQVDPSSMGPLRGEDGLCGCGGVGGAGGLGGRGGGASIALYVANGAEVAVQYSRLGAGTGGAGAAGGIGGIGGPGGFGSEGSDGSCTTGCYGGCHGSCGCDISDSATGGTPGTRGGTGGQGATGGGGSGGPSIAIVTVTAGFTDLGNNELLHEAGGMGNGGAASGIGMNLHQL